VHVVWQEANGSTQRLQPQAQRHGPCHGFFECLALAVEGYALPIPIEQCQAHRWRLNPEQQQEDTRADVPAVAAIPVTLCLCDRRRTVHTRRVVLTQLNSMLRSQLASVSGTS
jgi:hypothetical protein